MIKTIVSLSLAAVMMSFTTGGASAWWPVMPSNDVSVKNEWTKVETAALSSVNTGSNTQIGGGWWSAPKLTTGQVTNVGATAGSQVNMTFLPACNCGNVGDITVFNKATFVNTSAIASVNTGTNMQKAGFVKPELTTGAVGTVGSVSTSTVNWTQFGVSDPS